MDSKNCETVHTADPLTPYECFINVSQRNLLKVIFLKYSHNNPHEKFIFPKYSRNNPHEKRDFFLISLNWP